MLTLRELTLDDESAFFSGLAEWPEKDHVWYTFIWKPGMPYSEMLAQLRKERDAIDLPEGRVPGTMLYGFVDDKIVGRVSVRHRLNDNLKRRGGHLGYSVAPPFRGAGYATEMAKQALDYCRSLGLVKILITCADTNQGSIRVIEKCGAALPEIKWDETDQENLRHYWLDLAKTP